MKKQTAEATPTNSANQTRTPRLHRVKQLAKVAFSGSQEGRKANRLDKELNQKAMEGVDRLEQAFRKDEGPAGVIAQKFDSLIEQRTAGLPSNVGMDRKTVLHNKDGKSVKTLGSVTVVTPRSGRLDQPGYPLTATSDNLGMDPFNKVGQITELTISEDIDYDTEQKAGKAKLSVRFISRPDKTGQDPVGEARAWDTRVFITPQEDGSFTYGAELQTSGYNRDWSGFRPIDMDPQQIEDIATLVNTVEAAPQG